MAERSLTRAESKAVTRRRLLDAAIRLLAAEGQGKLSASAVAREAGMAQPTFYVHFRDKADLIRTIGVEQTAAVRQPLRAARERLIRGEDAVAAVREAFRVPLDVWIANPDVLRLYTQALRQPSSVLGDTFRALRAEMQQDLVDDLARFGLPSTSPEERERIVMIADAIMAQLEALGLGHIEGRYADRDAVIEVLTQFTVGMLGIAMAPVRG